MYKVAVIGCGRIASSFDDDPKRKYVATHIGAYRRNEKTKVIALCDKEHKKLDACQKKWGISRGYTDYKKLLKNEDIDILSICTLADTHCRIIKEALANKSIQGIFCEKPISESSKGVKEIVQSCKRRKIILQIDHQRRFDPLHIKLRDMIRSKKYGDVQQANFYYTAGIHNTGTHMFDLLRFLFGDVAWVKAFLSKNPSYKSNDPNIDGILKFKNGLMATFQACDVKKYLMFELDCFLDDARFILKDSGFSLDFYQAKKSRNFSGYRELNKVKNPIKTHYQRNFMVNAVEHLVKCIASGKESVSSGKDGLASLKLIEAALESAKKEGRTIQLY